MMKLIMITSSMFLVLKFFNLSKIIIQNYILMNYLIMIFMIMMNNFYWNKIYYIYSMDNISFMLIILTIWILYISFLTSNKILSKKFNLIFMYLILTLLFMLLMCFLSMNLLMFYIFFESSLIPMMILIMGWGMQIDRVQASMYMLFYTLFGSLPLFLMIMFVYLNSYSLMMNILIMKNFFINNLFMYIMMILAFLIKMPMYLLHLWLPKAHVEAPISGSMILAGIMLKLGSYGLMRFMMMFSYLFTQYNYLIMMISLLGSLYASLICLNQIDLKIIVAYSSIVHMGTLMASMMTLMNWGFKGSFFMMIAHGLCSSALFCLVNFNYERINSRNLFMNKGMMNLLPSLTLWWFLLCSSNFSSPPSLNLFSELMLINSLMLWLKFNMLFLMFIIFMSTCYSIYVYSYSQHGMLNLSLKNFKFINCREFLILILHWIPLNFIFLILKMF